MRLADFILSNVESILMEWEVFARGIWPGDATDPATLRDHAGDILRATAADMKSAQTGVQQADKANGEGYGGAESGRVDRASVLHAAGRVRSGFDMMELVAEYRALRGSVIRLWRDACPSTDQRDLEDLTRFNESIDQSLTEAVRRFTETVDGSRQMFLAVLGHDLRNPLNSVMMGARVLTRAKKLDPESAEIASGIASSAAAMARMVNDLLDFTSTGLGVAIPLSVDAMDLKLLCQEVVEEMRVAHPTRTLHIASDGDLTGKWDGSRLRQVVSNLLGNAIQHGAEASPVKLSVSGEGPQVVLTVHNRGATIASDVLPTIFDPLVRGMPEREKVRRVGSIGLGLYISREIVAAHGGTIVAKSSSDDGTTFAVRLPRTVPVSGPGAPKQAH